MPTARPTLFWRRGSPPRLGGRPTMTCGEQTRSAAGCIFVEQMACLRGKVSADSNHSVVVLRRCAHLATPHAHSPRRQAGAPLPPACPVAFLHGLDATMPAHSPPARPATLILQFASAVDPHQLAPLRAVLRRGTGTRRGAFSCMGRAVAFRATEHTAARHEPLRPAYTS